MNQNYFCYNSHWNSYYKKNYFLTVLLTEQLTVLLREQLRVLDKYVFEYLKKDVCRNYFCSAEQQDDYKYFFLVLLFGLLFSYY